MQDISAEIDALRREWGDKLLILGHHYQHPSVLKHADALGDSLELARRAAAEKNAERIVFCGVHFMAESADMLTGGARAVYMPDTSAGCPMASMVSAGQAEQAWAVLQANGADWLPVLYVNSTAATKALCGRWGGIICTSSNAGRVLKWVYGQGKRPFFMPDEHLGTNTAHDMGVPDEAIRVYDPAKPSGGLGPDDFRGARIVVWKGYCHVHTDFGVRHVMDVRARWPAARIVVHPETPKEVVRLADAHGSTSQIIEYVRVAPDGAMIFIGTEARLVERLAEEYKGRRTIKVLSHSSCPNMAKTTEPKLLSLLRNWPDKSRVVVAPAAAAAARKALERMLSL